MCSQQPHHSLSRLQGNTFEEVHTLCSFTRFLLFVCVSLLVVPGLRPPMTAGIGSRRPLQARVQEEAEEKVDGWMEIHVL